MTGGRGAGVEAGVMQRAGLGGSRGLPLLATLVSLSFGCDSDLAPYNLVDGFRLLAIAAEPADLEAGSSVTLTPLVVGDPAPSFRWRWCPVTRGVGEMHGCAVPDEAFFAPLPSPEVGTASVAQITWPADPAVTEALCARVDQVEAPVDAPRLACEDERPEILILLEVTASTGERIVAVRPLSLVPNGGRLNQNPRIQGIRAGGRMLEEEATLGPGVFDLEMVIEPAASETLEGGDPEILRATWFVGGGEMDTTRTAFIPGDEVATWDGFRSNRWTVPEGLDAVGLWVVVRDERGGTSWLSRTLRAHQPANGAP